MSDQSGAPDFSPTTEHLFRAVSDLFNLWEVYEAVFIAGQDRLDALNRRTGRIFRAFQILGYEGILVRIAKLLAGEKSCGHAQASFKRAIEDLPSSVPQSVKRALDRKLTELCSRCEPITEWRNNCIAHDNLAVVSGNRPLAQVSPSLIGEVLVDIYDLLSDISKAVSGTSYGANAHGGGDYDAAVLVRVIELGNEEIDRRNAAKRANHKATRGGDLPSDFDDPLDGFRMILDSAVTAKAE